MRQFIAQTGTEGSFVFRLGKGNEGRSIATRKTAKRTSAATKLSQSELLKLRREARIARALRSVAGALGASLDLDELLELVSVELTDLLGASKVVLFLRDERKKELVSRGDELLGDRLSLPLNEGLLGHVARTGRLTALPSLKKSEFGAIWDELLQTKTAAALAAPLKNNLGRGIGVLLVLSAKERPWDDDDCEVVSVLAKQASIAIDNSRLLVTLIRKNQQLQQAQEQLTRRVRDLELLFELERSTAHTRSHQELAQVVMETLAKACNASSAILVMREDEGHGLVQYMLNRSPAEFGRMIEPAPRLRTSIYNKEEAVLAAVIETGRPLHLDSTGLPLHQEGVPEVVSMIGEPLDDEDAHLGAISLINKRGGPFTAEDLGLLRLVSANLATALRLFNSNRTRERAERLSSIGKLLSQVIHDLKSPLTVISGYVQLMENCSETPERRKYARAILDQFQALGAMQREVLAFARGETQVFARKVYVDSFLLELKAQLETELVGRPIELVIDAERKLVGHFDSERVTRALQNLVRNAAEALGEVGGEIRLGAESRDQDLFFKVSDNGPGIPEAVEHKLFQSFVTSGKTEGTGLGLAIVKRIVEEHGGEIRLLQQSPGAHFEFSLPGSLRSKPRAKGLSLAGHGEAESQEVLDQVPRVKVAKKKASVQKNAKKRAASRAQTSSKTTSRTGVKKAPTKRSSSPKTRKK